MMIAAEKASQNATTQARRSIHRTSFLWALVQALVRSIGPVTVARHGGIVAMIEMGGHGFGEWAEPVQRVEGRFQQRGVVTAGGCGDGPLVPQLAISHYLGGTEDVILADPDKRECTSDDPSSPAPGEGEEGAAGDTTSEDTGGEDAMADANTTEGDDATTGGGTGTEATVGDEGDDTDTDDTTDTQAASAADDDETDSGITADTEATDGTSGDDVTELPNTGAGTAFSGSADVVLVTLLSGIAVLCCFAAFRIRQHT